MAVQQFQMDIQIRRDNIHRVYFAECVYSEAYISVNGKLFVELSSIHFLQCKVPLQKVKAMYLI